MSLRQIFAGLFRMRQLYNIRHPLPLPFHNSYVIPTQKVLLRVPRPLPQQHVPTLSTSTAFRRIHDFARSLLSFTRHEAQRTAGYLRRVAARPGRNVAPLLAFIAAFLQESKTDEFKTNAACVAVREDVAEFSKGSAKPQPDFSDFKNISDLEFGNPLGIGCNAAVYEARMKRARDSAAVKSYDLAVKVLFNYSMHSNADEVSRMFENELLPYRLRHSSIIDVFKAFVDDVPRLPQCETLFTNALPQRLHPEGFGRSRTMFVLMDKYSCTLREDLLKRTKYGLTEGLAVFGQLLEGIVKLGKENIVHRDIKSDNILLTMDQSGNVNRVVISDFGCSLDSLRLNYTSPHVSRGGNRALMAPEVINAYPGVFSVIDYSRSDLWAVGTISYEIFSGFNPFFEGKLNSARYDESQLPEVLPERTALNNLVHAILRHDPSKRPSPSVAATACHMLLWDFPLTDTVPSLPEVRLWIMGLCVRLICGLRNNAMHRALLTTFLKRCNLTEIMEGWKLLTFSPVY